jgi:hypothetical protein
VVGVEVEAGVDGGVIVGEAVGCGDADGDGDGVKVDVLAAG